MLRLAISLIFCALSTSAFSGTLLSEKEKSLIPHIDLSFGVTAMHASDFEKSAQSPATIVFNETLKNGGSMSIIERGGEYAILVDFLTMFKLKNGALTTLVERLEPEMTETPTVCTSSCIDDMLFGAWDGFLSGGAGGAAIGGAIGAGAGAWVAGPAGAAVGGAIGGAGGAVVGGAIGTGVGAEKGSQSCDKEKEAAGCPAE